MNRRRNKRLQKVMEKKWPHLNESETDLAERMSLSTLISKLILI